MQKSLPITIDLLTVDGDRNPVDGILQFNLGGKKYFSMETQFLRRATAPEIANALLEHNQYLIDSFMKKQRELLDASKNDREMAQ